MKRFISPVAKVAAIAGVAIAVAACNGTQTETAATDPQPQVAPAAEVSPAPATMLSVDSVKFGRYVEPKTFAVGGLGTKFKSTDQLFATVQLAGTAENATVLVRLLDASSQAVAEQTRLVQPKTPMKVNFALSKAATAPIAAGTYTAETLLDGQVVNTTQITFE